jgi:nucleoside-triphosphatase THEP1
MSSALVGLLTGAVGAGKTTAAGRVIALVRRRGLVCGGLLAPALIDPCGIKLGIWGVDLLTGERHTLGACDLLIVDEIGKLELWSQTGLAPVVPRLASGQVRRSLVIVRASLLAELQARLGHVEQMVFELDAENRDELPSQILARLFGAREFDNSG